MNADINKQIEEEAEMIAREGVENLLSEKNCIDKMKLHSAIKMTYKMGYKSALHSSRWRKVEEELPEIDTQVLVKTSNDKFSISEMYIPKDCNGNILGDKEWKGSFSFKCSIVEWKPID